MVPGALTSLSSTEWLTFDNREHGGHQCCVSSSAWHDSLGLGLLVWRQGGWRVTSKDSFVSRVHQFSNSLSLWTLWSTWPWDITSQSMCLLHWCLVSYVWGETTVRLDVQAGCPRGLRTYPQLRPTPVRDDVMDVLVVAQAQGSAAHKGAHVQGQDGDEQRLPAFQMTVKQNGDKNDLRDGETRTSQ